MVVARTITILRSHSDVVELRVLKTIIEPEVEMIKANAILRDGSILYVSEAIGEGWREYSYHWQRKDKSIRRWDNAPHYKELPNFPHHVHKGKDIISGNDVDLTDALVYIEMELNKS